jgi:hypothetical protein
VDGWLFGYKHIYMMHVAFGLYDAVVEVGFLRKNKLCRFGLKAYFSFISAKIS